MRVARQTKQSDQHFREIEETYPWVHYLQNDSYRVKSTSCLQRWWGTLASFTAIMLLGACIFVDFPRQMDPFGWDDRQNGWFFALSRILWAVACMIIFFKMVLGHSHNMLGMCRNRYVNLVAESVWPTYLLCPIIYMNMYCTVNESIYMTMFGNVILGMGSMMCTFILTIPFMLLLMYPVEAYTKALTLPMLVKPRAAKMRSVSEQVDPNRHVYKMK